MFNSFRIFRKDKTVLDAASNGAFEAINLIAGIIANLVAFVSFIAFLNALISWFGMLVGHEYISFLWLFGKLFIPLAYSLGIPWEDCEQVGTVIATKSIVNEFVAYQKLGALKSEHLISVSLLFILNEMRSVIFNSILFLTFYFFCMSSYAAQQSQHMPFVALLILVHWV